MLSTPISLKATIAYDFEGQIAPIDVSNTLDGTSTVLSIKDIVIAEFGSTSPMYEIARCESGYRQFNSEGEVLRGIVNNDDEGVYQINDKYHLETSKKLGYDISTSFGNIAYARYLYDTQGLLPWRASEPCWAE